MCTKRTEYGHIVSRDIVDQILENSRELDQLQEQIKSTVGMVLRFAKKEHFTDNLERIEFNEHYVYHVVKVSRGRLTLLLAIKTEKDGKFIDDVVHFVICTPEKRFGIGYLTYTKIAAELVRPVRSLLAELVEKLFIEAPKLKESLKPFLDAGCK